MEADLPVFRSLLNADWDNGRPKKNNNLDIDLETICVDAIFVVQLNEWKTTNA